MCLLKINNLSKRFPTGELAVDDVSLQFPKGQITMIVGPSGAGKSTLIRCVNRLLTPTSGQVYLNDAEITALSPRDLRRERRHMGMIFQDHALIDRLTVMENVLSGRLGYVGFFQAFLRRFPQADVDRAFELLRRVELLDHIDKRADALSGGQRQRVGIARALMQADSLLLVDEPTASLDPKTSRQIMRLIAGLAEELGLTAIINIHDIPLAIQFGQRIIGMRNGTIVFDGTPEQLTDDVLTDIYGDEDWHEDAKPDDAKHDDQSLSS